MWGQGQLLKSTYNKRWESVQGSTKLVVNSRRREPSLSPPENLRSWAMGGMVPVWYSIHRKQTTKYLPQHTHSRISPCFQIHLVHPCTLRWNLRISSYPWGREDLILCSPFFWGIYIYVTTLIGYTSSNGWFSIVIFVFRGLTSYDDIYDIMVVSNQLQLLRGIYSWICSVELIFQC